MKRLLIIAGIVVLGLVGVGASPVAADGPSYFYFSDLKIVETTKPYATWATWGDATFWFVTPQFK